MHGREQTDPHPIPVFASCIDMEIDLYIIPAFPALLLSILVLFRLSSCYSGHARSKGRSLPPGPRGLPIVGNLFNMPKIEPWVAYRDLCLKYGMYPISSSSWRPSG